MSASPHRDQPLRPSVLDRLIDRAPQEHNEAPQRYAQVLRELKHSVRRDLELLLNTRWRCTAWPPDFEELENSLVNYGIPDFAGANLNAAEDPDTLLSIIRDAIARFEPRLKNVRIDLLPNSNRFDRTLRFRIDAVLHVDPVEDRIAFDSILEPSTGNFRVNGATQ